MENLIKAPTAEDEDNDAWDDTLLVKAYDSSIKLAKEQLAKRIAEATNNKISSEETEENNKSSHGNISVSRDSIEIKYTVGDYVRATYDDGIDYEAKIISINEESGTCLLKYIGYNNEQEVKLDQLVPTWGKKARRIQFVRSKNVNSSAGDGGDTTGKENKKSKLKYGNELLFSVPPPPPMPPMLNDLTEESEHLSAMLMSWYMSGYYTGLYHGQRMYKNVINKGRKSKK